MDISNPRRILAASLEGSESHLSRVIKGTPIMRSLYVFLCLILGRVRLLLGLGFVAVVSALKRRIWFFGTIHRYRPPFSEKVSHVYTMNSCFVNARLDDL